MEAFFFFFSIRSLQPSRNISISYCSHVPVAALLFFLYICSSSRLQDTLRSKTTLRMCCICMCQKWFARVSREGIQETWPAKQATEGERCADPIIKQTLHHFTVLMQIRYRTANKGNVLLLCFSTYLTTVLCNSF